MAEVAAAAAAAVAWVSSTAAAVGTATAMVLTYSGFTAGQIAAAGAIAGFAGKLALNAAVSALFVPSVERGGSPIQFKADPAAPLSGVMGRFGVAGRQVHANTWGKDNLYLSFVVALSLGPIQSYEKFTANTLEVTFPGAQGLAAAVEPYKDKMWQTRRLGLPTDAYLTIPTGVPDGAPSGGGTPFVEWTPAHTLPGIAHSLWTLKNNSKRASYESGVPAPIWILHGMKLWDPRQDSTYPGGVGSQRRDDWTTWGFTEDPYLHALAWARGHHKLNNDGTIDRSKRLAGVGAEDAAIDIPAFVEGANVCTANGWKIAGEWTTVDDKWQVLAGMLQAGGGSPLTRGAKISCMVEAPRTSILTLTGADIVGAVNLNVMASRRDRPNTIIPRVRLEAQGFEEVALGPVTASTYVTEDGGESRTREVPYRYVCQAKQGAELAAYGLANARETLKASIPCKPYLLGLRAGDAFTVNEPELGLNGQKFIVLKRAFDPSSDVVTLEVRSETDAKHAWALGQTANPPETPSLTYLRTATAPDATEWSLDAEALTEGLGTIPALVFTGAVTDESQADEVIFEYRVVDSPERAWAGAGVESPDVVRKEIPTVTTGTEYEGAVSYRKGILLSNRLVLGPVTAGDIIIVPPGARLPISRSPAYPITSDDDSITIAAHTVYFSDGTSQAIPSGSLTSLASGKKWGLFWSAGPGFEIAEEPAGSLMTTGRRVFLGWVSTSTSGTYPAPETPPPGWGGNGPIYDQPQTVEP